MYHTSQSQEIELLNIPPEYTWLKIHSLKAGLCKILICMRGSFTFTKVLKFSLAMLQFPITILSNIIDHSRDCSAPMTPQYYQTKTPGQLTHTDTLPVGAFSLSRHVQSSADQNTQYVKKIQSHTHLGTLFCNDGYPTTDNTDITYRGKNARGKTKKSSLLCCP